MKEHGCGEIETYNLHPFLPAEDIPEAAHDDGKNHARKEELADERGPGGAQAAVPGDQEIVEADAYQGRAAGIPVREVDESQGEGGGRGRRGVKDDDAGPRLLR